MTLLRAYEWILLAYFSYAAVVSMVLPLKPPVPAITVSLNALILAGYLFLAFVDRLRRTRLLSVVRDWFPAPLMLLAYREMGWFAQPRLNDELEQSWVVWDRLLLNDWGVRRGIESLGASLPAILEISYSLVYAVPPFCIAMLYVYRRRERLTVFLFPFLLSILSCYALFPYFPSEPPRTVFPGDLFPTHETIFRRFNWWLLGGYGIHTSVFPSAHVGGAFAAAFGMARALAKPKWVSRLLLVMAVLIATATVYGRYHYAVDAVAGLAISLAAAAFARWAVR